MGRKSAFEYSPAQKMHKKPSFNFQKGERENSRGFCFPRGVLRATCFMTRHQSLARPPLAHTHLLPLGRSVGMLPFGERPTEVIFSIEGRGRTGQCRAGADGVHPEPESGKHSRRRAEPEHKPEDWGRGFAATYRVRPSPERAAADDL